MEIQAGRGARRERRRKAQTLACLAWFLLMLTVRAHAGPAIRSVQDAPAELWLAVVLNGQSVSAAALVLRSPDRQLFVSRLDLMNWRLRIPRGPHLTHVGEDYLRLDALPGLTYRVDEPSQTLIVNALPSAFMASSIHGTDTEYEEPTASPPGAFLNYELTATRSRLQAEESALLEPSVFGRWGSGVSDFLESHVNGHERMVRLDTTWTHDQPESATTLRIGDSITGASNLWGGAVRFAGVQWGTDFATRPGLITFPLPTIGGS